MSRAGVVADVVTGVESAVAPLTGDWDGLADRVGVPAFLRPGWVAAWWRAFGTGRLEIVTVRRRGRLAGLVPLHRPAPRAPGFKTEPLPLGARPGTLRATANWYTPTFGFLAEDEGAAAELAGAVFASRPALVSVAFLSHQGDEGAQHWRRAAASGGYRVIESPLPPSPYVDLDGDWAAFQQRLGSKLRSDLRRRHRRLAEEGTVEVDLRRGDGNVEDLVEEGFGVEPSGWKAAQGSAVLSRPETRQFYLEVARWAAGRGILRLAFLRVGGRAAAFQFAFEEDGVYSFLKGGYDPAFERHAPGKLLVQAMLERAHEIGLARFDFLGGNEAWKLEWTDSTASRSVVHAFDPGLRGRFEALVVLHGRPARAALRARAKAWRGR